MKLSMVKRFPNRIDLNTNSLRRTALELFDYFCFFVKKKRFDRIELQSELNMMRSGDQNAELCSVERFDRTELLSKIKFEKFGYGSPWPQIELVRFNSIRNALLLR